MKVTQAIKTSGFGISGDIGGLPRKTYYTPDGQTVQKVPSIREYVVKDKEGTVVETGTRDANFDGGLLATMPTELKPHCPNCNGWHDAEKDISSCAVTVKKRRAWGNKLAGKLVAEESGDIEVLRNEVAELKNILQGIEEKHKGE